MTPDGWAIFYGHNLRTFTWEQGRLGKLVDSLHGLVIPMAYILTDISPELLKMIEQHRTDDRSTVPLR